MSNSFRIEASELAAWHRAIAPRTELRGVPAIAKEIEAHLARKEPDGTVVVSRHQLFTWAEALQGASVRDASNALPPVIAEMRAILSGKPAGTAQAPVVTAAAAPVALTPAPPSHARGMYSAPPPVSYTASGATSGARVVSGAALGDAVRETIRGATRELYISSPWATGIETLVADVVATSPQVRVLILSRRPERDDGPFHQAMDQLGRRRAITGWSPFVQTRLVIADETRAIVGAASAPTNVSREVGLVVTDAATIRELRAHFERAHQEAAGGKY